MKIGFAVILSVWTGCLTCHAQSVGFDRYDHLFSKPKSVVTRWSSFENLSADKGEGGRENQGAKGHAFDSIKPAETRMLLDVAGSGVVRRMWITLRPRDPKTLRALRLEMYWDGSAIALFYLDQPTNGLPPLTPVELRTAGLE